MIVNESIRGDPQKPGELKKNRYSYMFKLQSPSKYSPFDVIHQLRHFFHCSKQFLNLSVLMLFSVSAVFLFQLFHIVKMFPFEDFFHLGKQKKVTQGEIG